MKILINHSKTSHKEWEEEQKKGWYKIIDVPTPYIAPQLNEEQIIERMVIDFINTLPKGSYTALWELAEDEGD